MRTGVIPRLFRADGQSADAVTGEIHISQHLGALDAQILIERALHNAEHGLILAGMVILAALRPAMRAKHGFIRCSVRKRISACVYMAMWCVLKLHRSVWGKCLRREKK